MFVIKLREQRGLTLIELLVVIAIISLLSSVVLASLGGARESARDVTRKRAVDQIHTAIEMYINQNGSPPFDGNGSCYASHQNSWSNLSSELSSYTNSGTLPEDPVNEWPLSYYYCPEGYAQCPNSGSKYVLFFATESSEFDLPEYNIQGEGDSAHRYCIYP